MSDNKVANIIKSNKNIPKIDRGNVYSTLMSTDNHGFAQESPFLGDRMQAFGTEEFTVPVILDHSMPGCVSGLSNIYYRAYYNGKTTENIPEDHSDLNLTEMLTKARPNRDTIDYLLKRPIKSIQHLSQLYSEIKDIKTQGPASSGFDEKKVKAYYDKVDAFKYYIDSALIRLIIGSTVFIPFEDLMVMVRKSWANFVKKNAGAPFYLFICDKVGSEHMITTHMHKEIADFKFVDIIRHNDFKNKSGVINIVIFDDVIYTGVNILGTFDELGYDIRDTFNGVINVHVIVGAGTDSGITAIKDLPNLYSFFRVKIYFDYKLLTINDIVSQNQLKLVDITNMKQAQKFKF